MTTRQSFAASQRITARTGRTDIGFSTASQAVMVHIDWTSAPVVKMTARKDLLIDCQIVAVVRNEYFPIKNTKMTVAEGKVLHFVASSRGDGWYYVVSAGRCSCPAKHNPKAHGCKHLDRVQVYTEQAERRAAVVEAEKIVAEPVVTEQKTATGRYHAGMFNFQGASCYISDEEMNALKARVEARKAAKAAKEANEEAFPNKKVQEHKRAPQFASVA